jgi:hypothetical protein
MDIDCESLIVQNK